MYRIKPIGTFLTEDDYQYGFGINTSLYNKIDAARIKYNELHPENQLPLKDSFIEDYDVRIGFNIAGKPFNTRHHVYHDLKLYENETGKRYVVDSVHKHHYFGYYIMLLIRAEGSNSHGSIYWENITCKDPTVIEGIEEAHSRFYGTYRGY